MEPMEIVNEELHTTKKEVKRTVNYIMCAVFLYSIIMYVVVTIDMLVRLLPGLLAATTTEQENAVFDKVQTELVQSGTSSLIAVLIGCAFFVLYFLRSSVLKKITFKNRKMKTVRFLQILVCFMSAQALFSLLSMFLEVGLNQVGYTIMGEIISATSYSTTVSMFLYAAILGPITEELIFRGFVLRGLEPYGKGFAIIVSAIVFGAFHGNLVQGIFAFTVGVIFAYVTLEYSITWSIFLHIINNLVFGDALGYLLELCSVEVQSIIQYTINIGFVLGAVVIFYMKRKQIGQYLRENRVEKKRYRYAFTTIWMILFLALELLAAFSGIEKL